MQYAQKQAEQDKVWHHYIDTKASHERKLKEDLDKINVHQGAYFGGTFVGNMCVICQQEKLGLYVLSGKWKSGYDP